MTYILFGTWSMRAFIIGPLATWLHSLQIHHNFQATFSLSLPILSAAIGRHQALKGYISIHWTTLASISMDYTTSPDHTAARHRIKSVLRGLHDHTRRLWLHRNSVLHSSTDAEMADIRSQELAEIKNYHSHPNLLLSTDQHYCNRSLPRLLSSSAATRRRWLRIVKRSSAELTKDGTRQTLLTSFFPPSGS